ncbi:hypothetical protein G9A89_015675 [Geosiphon pyriformis]|nr:hypothetical protein G9A89_015675 [Geosiphon pyriformis]
MADNPLKSWDSWNPAISEILEFWNSVISCENPVWHPDSHIAGGFTSRHTADTCTYFMKALHHQLPVAVHKHLYGILQLFLICALDLLVSSALFKGFVFNGWFLEAVFVFHDPRVVRVKITEFVHSLCLIFRNDIWVVHAKHCAFIKKCGLISMNGSAPILVFGSALKFLAGVVKLLGISEAFGVCFGYRKLCLFFSGIDISVFVNIIV